RMQPPGRGRQGRVPGDCSSRGRRSGRRRGGWATLRPDRPSGGAERLRSRDKPCSVVAGASASRLVFRAVNAYHRTRRADGRRVMRRFLVVTSLLAAVAFVCPAPGDSAPAVAPSTPLATQTPASVSVPPGAVALIQDEADTPGLPRHFRIMNDSFPAGA